VLQNWLTGLAVPVPQASQWRRPRIQADENEKFVAAGPVSRILSALRRDGHSSGPRITARLKRPTRRLWRAEPARVPGKAEASLGNPSLFGLAPCGVCPARRITAAAVRSYRTFSPLPEPCGPGGMFSVALSVQPAWAGRPGRYPAHCSAEFGLSSVLRQRPSGPAANPFIIVQADESADGR
jgi:hypothetical protein